MIPAQFAPRIPRALLRRLADITCVVVLLLRSSLFAAENAPSSSRAGDEPIALSPFVITESSETGWVANETLAGSRLRTNFRDVPNQIETLTKDFMQDLAVTNIDEALIYTANVENITEYTPLTAFNQTNFPGDGGRVRGVGSGTLSRNFFKTRSPTDNYNVDRATVASGPNAILFGLGSPAGILDVSSARALMRNHYGFTLQYDSENSKRGTFDANVVVLPQKLSFRLMGLSKRTYTEKQPNLDRNDRLYATLTFKPFKNTTISLQSEGNSRTWNKAGRVPPSDYITPWLMADKVLTTPYTAPKPIFDNSIPANFTAIAATRIFTQASENPVLIQGGSVPMQSWRNSAVVRNPSTLPGVDPTFDTASTFSLLDPKVFPFDVNIQGLSRGNDLGGYNKTFILEQKLANDLFLELAYNRDDSTNQILAVGGMQIGDVRLDVDANRFIPGTTTPNPNVGQYYFQGASNARLQFFHNEDFRATLSYEIDLARRLGSRSAALKWLGHHRLSGLYSQSREETRDQSNFDRRILDDPVIPGITLRAKTFQNWATDPTRVPQYRHYFANPYEPTTAAGPFRGEMTLTDANGRPYNLYSFETPLRAADGKRLAAAGAPSGVKNRAEAQVFVWQGFFLPDREHHDRLVLTYGYRKDSARSAGFDAASVKQDFSGLYPAVWDANFGGYGPEQTGINRNVGVVVRPFRWLSFSANKSTTFDLNIGRFDPFGNELPGAGGDGRDYSVRLDLWRDKLSLKVNKYETTLGPSRAVNQINTFMNVFRNVETRVVALDPTAPRINVTDGNMKGFPTQTDYNINSDFSGKGYEAELNFTPTRNLNLRLNGSKGESTETNIGIPWFQWLDQRLPVWQSLVATNGEKDSAGRPVTWTTAPFNASQPNGQTLAQYYQSQVVGQAMAFIKAVDGRSNPTVRSGRINAIVNYRFSEGRLKGLNVGGALRYRGAPIIGYGTTTTSAGTKVLDLDTVYKGEPERFVDFMAGYRGKLKAFGGMNYRLQLNIRNLLNDNDPVPVGALTTGAIYRVATVEPRLTALTFGVDF